MVMAIRPGVPGSNPVRILYLCNTFIHLFLSYELCSQDEKPGYSVYKRNIYHTRGKCGRIFTIPGGNVGEYLPYPGRKGANMYHTWRKRGRIFTIHGGNVGEYLPYSGRKGANMYHTWRKRGRIFTIHGGNVGEYLPYPGRKGANMYHTWR